jgi:hypothetical protein
VRDIVIAHGRVEAGTRQTIAQLARQHGRAMTPAGASEANR